MKIEVQGKTVEVDDSFASLSPEKKQATVDEIANSLSAQQKSTFEDATGISETSPLFGAGVGAIGGMALGHMIEGGAKAAMVDPRSWSAASGPGGSGEKWLRNWAGMDRPGFGGGVPEASSAYERTKGHGKVSERVTQRFGPEPKLTIADYTEAQRARPLSARISAGMPDVVRRAGQGIQGAAASMPAWAGRGMAGAGAGFQGVDTMNRFREGDVLGGVISGLGALGSGAALIPHPLTRGIGTAVGVGAPLLNELIDRVRKQNQQPQPQAQPQPQPTQEQPPMPMASGGLAHLSDGGSPKARAVKKIAEMTVGRGPLSIEKIKQQAAPLWERFGYDPKKISQQYPEVLPPVEKVDPKSGKSYLAKQLSSEALAVQKARQAAQKEIDAGTYSPYFDITKRSYVDPASYPMPDKTLDLTMPKKAETLARHRELAQGPEPTARLESAYEAAAGSPTAHGFYQMRQLEDEYIKELGPEAGRVAFKRDFALPMAATTGGQTPTANLMMAAMHNYYANKGMPMPSRGYDIPYPVGGNKLQSNIDKSQQLFSTGALSAVESPKRYNFASDFMGHRDRPTIDEQMMGLFQPGGKGAPDWYGVNEEAVNILAKRRGVDPVNYQEVAWAGAKGYPGQPMIEDINQMIYRTSRITGEPQDQVLKRFIRREGPMYGITGLGAAGLENSGGVNNPE